MSEYEQIYDDQWFEITKTGTFIACCDCSLVHEFRLKEKDGKIFMRAIRDERKTSALRRHHKPQIKKRK